MLGREQSSWDGDRERLLGYLAGAGIDK
jgi:hypothetical protein